jgi:transposase
MKSRVHYLLAQSWASITLLAEYARDGKRDGFHEVHFNTMEGFWSLLRSWSRLHRGISQEKLPCCLALFEFVHNVLRRGKAWFYALLAILITP